MSAASNFLENKILDHVLKNTAYAQPANLYLALFNNTSTNAATNLEAGTLTDEVSTSGTAYARTAITFNAASSGSATNNGAVTFAAATGAGFGTVTHVAVMDSDVEGSGNVLFWGAVTTAKTIDAGDTFAVSNTNLTISLA
jgi:hypothetical protein